MTYLKNNIKRSSNIEKFPIHMEFLPWKNCINCKLNLENGLPVLPYI